MTSIDPTASSLWTSECAQDWFKVAEIEVNSRCNRKCSYCPVAVLPYPPVPKQMSAAIFERVVAELARIEYAGRISYHFYNEPLLCRDLELHVAHVRRMLPHAFQLLYSNGELLTDERHGSLLDAGIDHILVTRHGEQPMAERPYQTVLHPRDLSLTNRAGLLTAIQRVADPLREPCFGPTDMLIVSVTGEVLLCCDDATRSEVMGNLADESIEDIWFGERISRIRERLQSGDREGGPAVCHGCSNHEYFAQDEAVWPDPYKTGMPPPSPWRQGPPPPSPRLPRRADVTNKG